METTLRNDGAKLGKKRPIVAHVMDLIVAILVGLERGIFTNEKVNATESTVLCWHNWLHNLSDSESRDSHLVKDHDLAVGSVEVLMYQSNTDTPGDMVFLK